MWNIILVSSNEDTGFDKCSMNLKICSAPLNNQNHLMFLSWSKSETFSAWVVENLDTHLHCSFKQSHKFFTNDVFSQFRIEKQGRAVPENGSINKARSLIDFGGVEPKIQSSKCFIWLIFTWMVMYNEFKTVFYKIIIIRTYQYSKTVQARHEMKMKRLWAECFAIICKVLINASAWLAGKHSITIIIEGIYASCSSIYRNCLIWTNTEISVTTFNIIIYYVLFIFLRFMTIFIGNSIYWKNFQKY